MTITIEGEPHNFTLLKNVTVKTLYRFNGTCLENVSTCRIVSYLNGTKINTCREFIWNASVFKLPQKSLKGVPVRVRNRTVSLSGENYTLILPEWVNASTLKLEAFEAGHGVVLINTGVIHVSAGVSINEIPLLFKVENRTARPLGLLTIKKLICASAGASTTKAALEDNGKKSTCEPAFLVLLVMICLLAKRTLRRR
ncbi:hypothetical protein [Thermococcus sp.]